MSKLKEYDGYYCESEYESTFIDFLENEVGMYHRYWKMYLGGLGYGID